MEIGTRLKTSIYNYDHVSDFLNAIFQEIKLYRSSFSIRAWSKHLKVDNPTSLARILSNQRRIPKRMVEYIADYLKLDPNAKAYFELLALGKDRINENSLHIIRKALLELEKKN